MSAAKQVSKDSITAFQVGYDLVYLPSSGEHHQEETDDMPDADLLSRQMNRKADKGPKQ